ncbi:MAG: DUF2029 domain-containing protein [Candidatus Cloacimonetes bacterium]|nr:DUF2029 domain-containing protein [Candidatus Cloacimonadota bacterium]
MIISIFAAVTGFYLDLIATRENGGIDLRNRIIGARLLRSGVDPYFFKWDRDTDERFVDPRDYYRNLPVSRVTVPPTLLFLHQILADIPYLFTKYLWLFLQWLMFLIILYIMTAHTREPTRVILILFTGLLYIAGSYIWRLHTDRGQIYIFYVLLMSLSFAFLSGRSNLEYLLGGILAGITAALRFPYLLVFLPFLLGGRWKFIIGGFTGFAMTIAASFFCCDLGNWQMYFKAMKVHELYHLGYIKTVCSKFPAQLVENLDNLEKSLFIHHPDSSIQGIFYRYWKIRIDAETLILVFVTILTVSVLVFLIMGRKKKYSDEIMFLSGINLVFLSEFFLPAFRFAYNNVIWLLPISLQFILVKRWIAFHVLLIILFGIMFVYPVKMKAELLLASDYLILFYCLMTNAYILMKYKLPRPDPIKEV